MMTTQKKILVTGATGAIAPLLVRELVEQNHQVKVLARREIPKNLLPKKTEIVKGDLLDKKSLRLAAKDAEWIFHFAAKLHINNPDENLKAEYEATNVEATKNLIEFSRATCEKFIFASTINVYGTSGGGGAAIFDETSKLNPDGFYAETKAAAEKLVLAENGVVLRLAAVYGSRMKGNFPRLAGAIKKGRFVFIGDGGNRRTLIHEKDVARAAILAAESERTNGEIYNVTDGQIHTLREIVAAISEAFGKKPPKIKLPLSLVKPAVGLSEDLLKLVRKRLDLRNMLDKINEDMAVSGAKIRRDLGFVPQYDLKNGWKQTVKNPNEG